MSMPRRVLSFLTSGSAASTLRLLLLLGASAAISALVANAVAHPHGGGHSDLLRPAEQSARKTTQLSQQTLHPTIAGDGTVVQVGRRYEIHAAIQNTDLAYKLSLGHFTVRALIVGGPTGFDCPWLGLRPEGGAAPQMACEVPPSIRVVSGLQASMVLAIDAPKAVQALPLSAVIGAAQQGQVIIVDSSGGLHAREVELGASDDQWIEIRQGLVPGQRVLLDPTQSDLSAS